MISRILASLNQGKWSYAANSSRPSRSSQNPVGVTFVIATCEVVFPRRADFIPVLSPAISEDGRAHRCGATLATDVLVRGRSSSTGARRARASASRPAPKAAPQRQHSRRRVKWIRILSHRWRPHALRRISRSRRPAETSVSAVHARRWLPNDLAFSGGAKRYPLKPRFGERPRDRAT